MDRQAFLNRVVAHCNAQGERAGTFDDGPFSDFICQYLDADGRRCAIGCLLPSDHPALNSPLNLRKMLGAYPSVRVLLEIKVLDTDTDFLESLQHLHDSEDNWTRDGDRERLAPAAVANLAETYGLRLPEGYQ